MYRVVKDFTDLQDDKHIYIAGDIYPRDGVEPSESRIAELGSTANIRGEVLIELVKEKKKTKAKREM